MAKSKLKKPILLKVGQHFLDPTDVACISKIKGRNLFVVRLKSQPNMEYPVWAKESELAPLFDYFEIKVTDISEVDE